MRTVLLLAPVVVSLGCIPTGWKKGSGKPAEAPEAAKVAVSLPQPKPSPQAQPEPQKPQPAPAPAPKKEKERLEVGGSIALWWEFQNNPAAADLKFRNKRLTFLGFVDSIKPGRSGGYLVHLGVSQPTDHRGVYLFFERPEQVAQVQAWAGEYQFAGEVQEFKRGELYLNNCEAGALIKPRGK